MRTLEGDVIQEGEDTLGPGTSWTAYDYFMAAFPIDYLLHVVCLTSTKLRARGAQLLTAGEVLKLIGGALPATRYEVRSRADLWWTQGHNKYMHAPAYGQLTGLSYPRYDALWS